MSQQIDLSPETALQNAMSQALGDDGIASGLLGDPIRLREPDEARPAFPYLEFARHEVRDAGGADAELAEHRLDLRLTSRWGGRDEGRVLIETVRRVIALGLPDQSGWRIVYAYPVISDVLASRNRQEFTSILRVSVLTERIGIQAG